MPVRGDEESMRGGAVFAAEVVFDLRSMGHRARDGEIFLARIFSALLSLYLSLSLSLSLSLAHN